MKDNLSSVKEILSASDVLTYSFSSLDGSLSFAVVYADGIVDKTALTDAVARPLSTQQRGFAKTAEEMQKFLLYPEVKTENDVKKACDEILDGNSLLLCDGVKGGVIFGAKSLPSRAVAEPPTDMAVKGPREGFVEDVKTNMALIRKRFKTPALQFETLKVGRRSKTAVVLCFLDGITNEGALSTARKRLENIDVDFIADSSYIATLISPRTRSVFRQTGTTEKPDVFSAKIAEGRVGILVDGSPIALTVPFLAVEDFQSSEDYTVSPFMATITRTLRLFSVLLALLLPAFYVSSQLFKLQLLPLGLLLTVASSIQGLPLSPSLEMFLVLLVLEVIKEASVRMPKYVGMALSIVGALVLGETAVSAGFVSTPAIIIVAFSGICLYTVPNFNESGSILRWLFLIVSGSIGPFGIVLLLAFLLYYLISSDAFGAPMLSPFSPLSKNDFKDALWKRNLVDLSARPRVLGSKNKRRAVFTPKTAKAVSKKKEN